MFNDSKTISCTLSFPIRRPTKRIYRSLSAERPVFNWELFHFSVVVCAYTHDNSRSPCVPLFRSWHGDVPGVDYITINERTANYFCIAPTVLFDHKNYNVTPAFRNLFRITNINVHSPSAAWNAILIIARRQNEGACSHWTLHIPFYAQYYHGRFDTSVKPAFANLSKT